MSDPERFSIVAPLDPLGGWRRALALDRGPGTPRAVVLAFVPEEISSDTARLGRILRDVEVAGRLHHAAAVPVLGTETVGDALAVVEPHSPGTTIRAVLEAGGRFPADVASRVALDACAAIVRAHTIDSGDGKPLFHGSVECARIAVGDDGAAALSGFAQTAEGDAVGDLRALGAVLHEMITGHRPGEAAADAPALPEALSPVLARALGTAPDGPFPSADAFAEVLGSTVPAASHAAVAAFVESILPKIEAHPSALRSGDAAPSAEPGAEEAAAENLVEAPDASVAAPAHETPPADAAVPAPQPVEPADHAIPGPTRPVEPPVASAPPADDAATSFPVPLPRRLRPYRLAIGVAAACGVVGFAGGFGAARLAPDLASPPPVTIASPEPAAAAEVPAAPEPAPAPKAAKASRRGGRPPRAGAEETSPAGAATKAQPAAEPGASTEPAAERVPSAAPAAEQHPRAEPASGRAAQGDPQPLGIGLDVKGPEQTAPASQ